MAWYNSLKDLTGDIKGVASNPLVDVGLGLVGGPALAAGANALGHVGTGGASAAWNGTPKGTSSGGNVVTDANGNPVSDPNAGQSSGGGLMDWLGNFISGHGSDILKTGGAVASGVVDNAQKQAQLKQQADQFNKNYGLAQNTQGMAASRALNAAPLLDKGQYLAQNFAAPTAFQPRDITRGIGQFQNPGAQGGAAAQLAANSAASANYKQGDGGYDTSTLKAILSRLQMSPQGAPAQQPSAAPQGPTPNGGGSTTTVNYGGQQFSPQDWQTFQQKNQLQGYA